MVQTRFDKLNTDNFIPRLILLGEAEYRKFFLHMPCVVHRYLFNGIFSNAGQYRLQQDPKQGMVLFGARQQFRGAGPAGIKEDIQQAVAHLHFNAKDPVYDAVKFYQQFVLTHPFYDANGRIGRFLLETHLNLHGIVMEWKKLYANEKWIKKLNSCHRRMGSPEYENYLAYLVAHWRKFTFVEETYPMPGLHK